MERYVVVGIPDKKKRSISPYRPSSFLPIAGPKGQSQPQDDILLDKERLKIKLETLVTLNQNQVAEDSDQLS